MKQIYLILFLAFIHYCNAKSIRPLAEGKNVLFNETVGGSIFGASGFGGTWRSGKEFTFIENGHIKRFNVETTENETLIENFKTVSMIIKNKRFSAKYFFHPYSLPVTTPIYDYRMI